MIRISILVLLLFIASPDARSQRGFISIEKAYTFKVEPISDKFCKPCVAAAFKVQETDYNPSPKVIYILEKFLDSLDKKPGFTLTLKGTIHIEEKWDNDCFASKKVVTFFLTPASSAFFKSDIY